MLFMVNADAIFTLYNGDIEDIDFGTFLEFKVKEGIKFIDKNTKSYPMLYGHKNVIYL